MPAAPSRLANETKNLLIAQKLSPKGLTRIGLIVGPGSFTGLRIGLSFVKGLALANPNLRVFPFSSHRVMLEEIQRQAGPSTGAIVTPGYQKDLVYISTVQAPEDIEIRTIAEFLRPPLSEIFAPKLLQERLESAVPSFHPTEISLRSLAHICAHSKEGVSGRALDDLEPRYVTDFVPGKV